METPPPYYPPTPRKSNTALIVLLVVLAAIAICCAGVLGLGFWGFQSASKTIFPFAGCAQSFEAIHQAMLDYAEEHDGTLPPTENWEEAIRPYYETEYRRWSSEMADSPIKIDMMPPDGPWGCQLGEGRSSGIAYNEELAGKKLDEVAQSAVLLFEVPEQGENLVMPFKRQDSSTAPEMFGEKRPWLEMPVSGNMDSEFGESVRIETEGAGSTPAEDAAGDETKAESAPK